jgi:hypothetical protein
LSVFQALHHKQNKGKDSDTPVSEQKYDSHRESMKMHQYNLSNKRNVVTSISGTKQTAAIERFTHSNVPFNFANIQTKLKVSQPGDEYEQAADRIAEQVITMSVLERGTSVTNVTNNEAKIERKCKDCDEEEEENKEQIKTSRKTSSSTVNNMSDDAAQSIDGILDQGGSPIDASTREFMGSRFSYDFSKVRIHADTRAGSSAQAINALAYTMGHHIIFGPGQYVPNTTEGKRLLAHELTHIVQQSKSQTSYNTRLTASSQVSRQQTSSDERSVSYYGGQEHAGTVICLTRWASCTEPDDPGTWGATLTYHCPVSPGTPGTTQETYVMIPDEFIGGGKYRCRAYNEVDTLLEQADIAATEANLKLRYPTFNSCHQGYRRILNGFLAVAFRPRRGGRPWGGRVQRAKPPGFPC